MRLLHSGGSFQVAKILIVDDEPVLLDTLRYNLAKGGYAVQTAVDGEEALMVARQESSDLIILDIMLPKMDGFEVCRALRQRSSVPVLMLTARGEEGDKVLGLELGADDYMTKPFSMRELLARVKAMLRRAEVARSGAEDATAEILRERDLELDLGSHRVTFHGGHLHLKPKEFDLLAFLMRHRGRAFSRQQLLDQVWGYDYDGGTRTVDVHIRWIRQKVESEASRPELIETVRGIGYRFCGR